VSPSKRELAFSIIVVVVLALGIAYGAVVHSVAPVRLSSTIPLSGKSFSSRASYCPPSLVKMQDKTRIAVAPAGEGAVPVSVEPAARPSPAAAPSSTPTPAASPAALTPTPTPSPTAPTTIPQGRALFSRSARDNAVNVVGYAGAVISSAVIKGASGVGAAGCSGTAGRRWYFAEGSSALGYDERLILYNPFPDEAVARVSFITPDGKQTKANLSDQAVPAGATSVLRLNAFVLKEPLLSIEVDAIRGRLVAWRSLEAHPRGRPRGEQLSLGATNSHSEWFLPDGDIGQGYDERIALLNPSTKAARVTVSVLTAHRTVQPPKLLNITVPPASSKSIAPGPAITGCNHNVCGIGAVVTSTSDVGIVAERTIWYSTGHLQGVASEIGASRTATRWYLGPASFAPTRDWISVINPTTAVATVSVTLESDSGGPKSPASLQHLKVKAGTRLQIPLNRWTGGRPVIALLSSDEQVVAERSSYSRRSHDVSALMGSRLP
jgi:Family of unknown function (DUF5719)